MTRRRTLTLFAFVAASVLLARVGAAAVPARSHRPGDGAIAAALVRFAAESGIESLVIRSDDTQRGRSTLAAARAAASRYDVVVRPDSHRAGPDDALLILVSLPSQARAYCTIERAGRGVLLAPWLDEPEALTASHGRSQLFIAKVRANGLQLWTPANIAFLPPSLSEGHDHGTHAGTIRLALVRSSIPLD